MFNSDTYCALLILIELGDRYLVKGCTLMEISNKHHIPIFELEEGVPKLEGAGLIRIERDDKDWIFLKIAPIEIFISEVLQLFCSNFSGQFVDRESGEYLQQSNTLKFLVSENEYICKSIKNKLKKINLDKYCQLSRTRSY